MVKVAEQKLATYSNLEKLVHINNSSHDDNIANGKPGLSPRYSLNEVLFGTTVPKDAVEYCFDSHDFPVNRYLGEPKNTSAEPLFFQSATMDVNGVQSLTIKDVRDAIAQACAIISASRALSSENLSVLSNTNSSLTRYLSPVDNASSHDKANMHNIHPSEDISLTTWNIENNELHTPKGLDSSPPEPGIHSVQFCKMIPEVTLSLEKKLQPLQSLLEGLYITCCESLTSSSLKDSTGTISTMKKSFKQLRSALRLLCRDFCTLSIQSVIREEERRYADFQRAKLFAACEAAEAHLIHSLSVFPPPMPCQFRVKAIRFEQEAILQSQTINDLQSEAVNIKIQHANEIAALKAAHQQQIFDMQLQHQSDLDKVYKRCEDTEEQLNTSHTNYQNVLLKAQDLRARHNKLVKSVKKMKQKHEEFMVKVRADRAQMRETIQYFKSQIPADQVSLFNVFNGSGPKHDSDEDSHQEFEEDIYPSGDVGDVGDVGDTGDVGDVGDTGDGGEKTYPRGDDFTDSTDMSQSLSPNKKTTSVSSKLSKRHLSQQQQQQQLQEQQFEQQQLQNQQQKQKQRQKQKQLSANLGFSDDGSDTET